MPVTLLESVSFQSQISLKGFYTSLTDGFYRKLALNLKFGIVETGGTTPSNHSLNECKGWGIELNTLSGCPMNIIGANKKV